MVDFPLLANFVVLSVSASDEVTAANEKVAVSRRMSLILRARSDVPVKLSSGESLCDMETHLSLVTGLASPRELAPEMKANDLGFMLHSAARGEPPFIHGAVAWPAASLPYSLLTKGLRMNVLLTISSMPQSLAYQEPQTWKPGREHMLRLSAYSISSSSDSSD